MSKEKRARAKEREELVKKIRDLKSRGEPRHPLMKDQYRKELEATERALTLLN